MEPKPGLKNKQESKPKGKGAWLFLGFIIIIYLGFLIFNKDIFFNSITFFYNLLIKILPIFILIFVLMFLTNQYITPEFIKRHLAEKGIKKWIFVILGGILSDGPIYMWYPLLADFRDKGLNNGLIACFLYNRAIKIPLIPIAIFYFGWQYILLLTIVMVAVSVLQGKIINKLI
ncbi:MAG: hypothetical protein U9R08_06455 [Nanoarchaeota archaeon]|nr:hypothetical protein [Nanoarchaeota archaeon]